MLRTQKQFDDTVTKAAEAIAGFIKDNPEQKKVVLKFFQEEPTRLRKVATDRLSLDLTDPPPKDKKDSIYDIEDTSCTKDSPETPKEGGKLEEVSAADKPDPLKCHGVGGDVWMIHRDQAVSAAEQFCAQDIEEKV